MRFYEQATGSLHIGQQKKRYFIHRVTSNLIKRIWEHKNNLTEGFTKRYGVHLLVWYELHENMFTAITREKQLKNWQRKWKIQLIESENPSWQDLYPDIVG